MRWRDGVLVKTLPMVPRPVVRRVASRYVAGATIDQAISTIRRLNGRGAMATVDVLGEEVTDRATAGRALHEYLRVFDRIADKQLDCNVSIKLTQLGIAIDRQFCCDNLLLLLAHAAERGNFLRIDMEDHSWTDATLEVYRTVRAQYAAVGVVFQTMLYRTIADIESLPPSANIRLCKGIYREPPEVAWQDYDAIRQSYVRCLDHLFARGNYVGIATHDRFLIDRARELIRRYRVAPERYEFQMLLGVGPRLWGELLEQGHRVRVYVPYGEDWYAYSMRRLRENPTIAWHMISALVLPRFLQSGGLR